ncbi:MULTISPECIES: peroxiredoxin family protein [unclassified Acidovorax]|uniref:peroxiredoxin family protein n=1 Tax=unclassified Acidovorax TaxID=2684926 RepID=UPI00070A0E1A|nr:redoxin domain-containing protein [Acidovorax sp. Root217]KRC26106.1 alkyl hydroperoxide reductase [Acidovorax sp. Root217]
MDLHATGLAPELDIAQWINTDAPITLQELRGKVVVIHAFQMLCPGCVAHGLPQTAALRATFDERDVAVLGLHSVFEHHTVMTPQALKAFAHEYRLPFPIGIDMPGTSGPIPRTMQAYGLRGTPSLLLIDRMGRLRLNHFGRIDDMRVGALVAQLVAEPGAEARAGTASPSAAPVGGSRPGDAVCDADGCAVAG